MAKKRSVDPQQSEATPPPRTAQTETESESTPEETSSKDYVKLSLYLSPEEAFALDQHLLQIRFRTGKSIRRNTLIREAIQEYLQRA